MNVVGRGLLVVALAAPLATTLMLTQPPTAYACTCAHDTTRAGAALAVADSATGDGAVFVGTPTSMDDDGLTDYYEFDVREIFRGEVGAATTVSTPSETSACGTSFALDTEYLVFTSTYSAKDAPLSANSCAATTSSADEFVRAATVAQYGEPRPLTDTERAVAEKSTPATAWWWGAGAIGGIALAAAAGTLIWKTRKGDRT
ncbi:MAG: hypothetical protein WBQ44_22975 [Rhodococcus sp. (in: high G+C Gram-positive bacteria)]